jgi:hypothetical protein
VTWGNSYEGSSFAIDSVLEEGIHDSHSPERVLFLCVILQQLLDATKPRHPNDTTYTSVNREQAKAWLTSEVGVTAEDKETVCFLAGIEPEALTSYAKKIIDTKEIIFIRKRINAILHEPLVEEPTENERENQSKGNRRTGGWYSL